jgi:hypothetical protein
MGLLRRPLRAKRGGRTIQAGAAGRARIHAHTRKPICGFAAITTLIQLNCYDNRPARSEDQLQLQVAWLRRPLVSRYRAVTGRYCWLLAGLSGWWRRVGWAAEELDQGQHDQQQAGH